MTTPDRNAELARDFIHTRNMNINCPTSPEAQRLRQSAWEELVFACGGNEQLAHQLAEHAMEENILEQLQRIKK